MRQHLVFPMYSIKCCWKGSISQVAWSGILLQALLPLLYHLSCSSSFICMAMFAVGTTGPCAPCVLSFCCSAFCLSFLSPSLAPCTQKSISGQLRSWWPSQFPQIQGGKHLFLLQGRSPESRLPGLRRVQYRKHPKASKSCTNILPCIMALHIVTLSCVRHESCPSPTLQVCWMKTNPAVAANESKLCLSRCESVWMDRRLLASHILSKSQLHKPKANHMSIN